MERPEENSALRSHYRKVLVDLTERSKGLLNEIWDLWEMDPCSKAIREKFYLLEQNMDYLGRFCREKI